MTSTTRCIGPFLVINDQAERVRDLDYIGADMKPMKLEADILRDHIGPGLDIQKNAIDDFEKTFDDTEVWFLEIPQDPNVVFRVTAVPLSDLKLNPKKRDFKMDQIELWYAARPGVTLTRSADTAIQYLAKHIRWLEGPAEYISPAALTES